MRYLLTMTLFFVSCGSPNEPSQVLADAKSRRALGLAQEVTIPALTDEQILALHQDHGARRQLAWGLSENLLEPVSLSRGPQRLPKFFTWYGRDDLQRIFRHLLVSQTPEQVRQREPFTDQAIERALVWNTTMVENQPHFDEELYDQWLRQRMGTPEEALALGGLQRTFYSPAALQHLLWKKAGEMGLPIVSVVISLGALAATLTRF